LSWDGSAENEEIKVAVLDLSEKELKRPSGEIEFRARRRNSEGSSKASNVIQQTLIAQGLSQTEPRRLVLEVFLNDHKPLTPATVHSQLPDRVNLASVYRTIALFCRLGILTEVDHVLEGRRYELSDNYREHHHHLICRQCGKTEDFEDCAIADVEKLIRRRFRFKVTRHDLRFFGLCQRCQR